LDATNSLPELKLLNELGLSYLGSTDELREKIETLNMRQLDRLKLMLLRMESADHVFSEEIRTGIKNNDFAGFAYAVHALNNRRV
jgi:hypothetical protein